MTHYLHNDQLFEIGRMPPDQSDYTIDFEGIDELERDTTAFVAYLSTLQPIEQEGLTGEGIKVEGKDFEWRCEVDDDGWLICTEREYNCMHPEHRRKVAVAIEAKEVAPSTMRRKFERLIGERERADGMTIKMPEFNTRTKVDVFEDAVRHFGVDAAMEYFKTPEDARNIIRSIFDMSAPAPSAIESREEQIDFKDLIEDAVNAYFHQAVKELGRKDLGIIDKRNWTEIRDRCRAFFKQPFPASQQTDEEAGNLESIANELFPDIQNEDSVFKNYSEYLHAQRVRQVDRDKFVIYMQRLHAQQPDYDILQKTVERLAKEKRELKEQIAILTKAQYPQQQAGQEVVAFAEWIRVNEWRPTSKEFGKWYRVKDGWLTRKTTTDLHAIFTSQPGEQEQQPVNPESDWGICKECNKESAVTDYNGNNYWVCQPCYESLTRQFEDEYK